MPHQLEAMIRTSLERYDGRAVTILTQTAARYRNEPGYMAALTSLAADREGNIADAATWLIKQHLEEGGTLSCEQTGALIAALENRNDWATTLHICQSVRFLKFDRKQAGRLVQNLTPLLDHDRPFIRAWALDALCSVAGGHLQFQSSADGALGAAASDKAASVRARARNIAKRMR